MDNNPRGQVGVLDQFIDIFGLISKTFKNKTSAKFGNKDCESQRMGVYTQNGTLLNVSRPSVYVNDIAKE